MRNFRINAVMTGTVKPFGPNGEPSAIRKQPIDGPVALGQLGLDGDEHAYHLHGGPHKALFHYASDHYGMWKESFLSFQLAAGGFGENITTEGMTEANVCIGDRYRIGRDVVVEVSQPRQPCWKLGYNARQREIPRLMQERAAGGWYYRVISPGPVAAGDQLELTERPLPEWPVARVILGFYGDPLDDAFLRSLAEMEVLGPEWRTAAEKRLEKRQVEDWVERLYGPFADEGA